jgi:hypothetical protein
MAAAVRRSGQTLTPISSLASRLYFCAFRLPSYVFDALPQLP